MPLEEARGSLSYVSPEMQSGNMNSVSYPTDMWSLAVTICSVYLATEIFSVGHIKELPLMHQIRLKPSTEEAPYLGFEAVMQKGFLNKRREQESIGNIDSIEDEVAKVVNDIKDQIEFTHFTGLIKEILEFDPRGRSTPEVALSKFSAAFELDKRFLIDD